MNHMRVHDTTIKKLFNRGKIPNKRKIQQELYKNLQGTKDKHHKITYMINYQLLIENQLQIMLKVKRS